MFMPELRPSMRRALPLLAALLVAACAGGGGDVTDPPPVAISDFSFAVTPATLSVQAGQSGQLTASITRSNGFAAAVSVVAEGAPAGVTVAPLSITAGASSVTGGVAVGAGVAAGVYPITLRATGASVSAKTAAVSLTVTAAVQPTVTISLTPATLALASGAQGTVQATVSRGGSFAGAVTITSSGAPTGLTVSTPSVAAGATTAAIGVTAAASLAAGTYPITVRANGTGVAEATATLSVTISAAADYAVTLSPSTVSVAPGAQGTSTIGITRSGGFTGALSFAFATSPPTGMIVSLPATALTGSAAAITVSVGAQVAPGSYPLTINVTGTGVPTRTVVLTVVVPSLGAFTLAANPTAVSVTQGQTAQATVSVTRTPPHVAPVTLTVSGLPTGVSAVVNPNPVTGTSATVTFTATAGATTGAVSATISGSGGSVTSAPLTLPITVASSGGGGGSGNVTYSFCAESGIPAFVAYQDGSGPWTRVTLAANNTASFSLPSGRGGVASVVANGFLGSNLDVQYGTVQELNADGSDECGVTLQGGRTLTGTVSGRGPEDIVSVVAGGAVAGFFFGQSFTLNNVAPGPFDLLATRFSVADGPGKAIIRRDLNPANNSVLAPLDFNGPEAFDPVARTVTVGNGLGEELVSFALYLLRGGTGGGLYYFDPNESTETTRTWFGIPNNRRAAGDLHLLAVSAPRGPQSSSRTVTRVFREATNQSLTLPARLIGPTVTSLGASGGSSRTRAVYTPQADYGSRWSTSYQQAGQAITVSTTAAYNGAGTVTLDVPDLSGVSGWNSSWGLRGGVQVEWRFEAFGWDASFNPASTGLVEGAVIRVATREGMITP